MEIVITADTIIKSASLITALGVVGGVVVWCLKFVDRQKKQDKEISAIRHEQSIICYGILACLKGLREQGCNGPVTEALNKIERHLNQAAHEDGEMV